MGQNFSSYNRILKKREKQLTMGCNSSNQFSKMDRDVLILFNLANIHIDDYRNDVTPTTDNTQMTIILDTFYNKKYQKFLKGYPFRNLMWRLDFEHLQREHVQEINKRRYEGLDKMINKYMNDVKCVVDEVFVNDISCVVMEYMKPRILGINEFTEVLVMIANRRDKLLRPIKAKEVEYSISPNIQLLEDEDRTIY